MKKITNKQKQVLYEIKYLKREGNNYYSTKTREKEFVTGYISADLWSFIIRWQDKINFTHPIKFI